MAVIPSADRIREELEGYNITESIVSSQWIERRRDLDVIPFIENFIRTDIRTEQTVTEYLSGNGKDIIFLSRRSATEITNMEVIGLQDITGTISVASLELIENQGLIKAKSNISEGAYFKNFPKGDRNIKVIYKYGGIINNDVANAISYMTAAQVLDHVGNRTGGGSLGVQAFNRNYGPASKYSNYIKSLNNKALLILNRYSTGVVGSK